MGLFDVFKKKESNQEQNQTQKAELVKAAIQQTCSNLTQHCRDANLPYDYDLTNKLIDCAKEVDCGYALDVFYRYSTDGAAAFKMGNNIKAACFGMAVICSHGIERTHIDGLNGTTNMILEYMLRSDKND